mmetsp:Transcript_30649/g.79606  ORF Transcript_30649/g.79606 Transcript_30649/m.79606 type:complete len:220 (+) Transcript_30649:505-1164(+)
MQTERDCATRDLHTELSGAHACHLVRYRRRLLAAAGVPPWRGRAGPQGHRASRHLRSSGTRRRCRRLASTCALARRSSHTGRRWNVPYRRSAMCGSGQRRSHRAPRRHRYQRRGRRSVSDASSPPWRSQRGSRGARQPTDPKCRWPRRCCSQRQCSRLRGPALQSRPWAAPRAGSAALPQPPRRKRPLDISLRGWTTGRARPERADRLRLLRHWRCDRQ